MPGQGKYTQYNVKNSARKSRLEALFPGSDEVSHPFAGLDDDQSRAEAVARGNNILRAEDFGGSGAEPHAARGGIVDSGDPALGSVDLTYRGRGLVYTAPNGEIEINQDGDPMNAYVPDISSPGPGPISTLPNGPVNVRTDGTDKKLDKNPRLTPQEVKPNYTPSDNTAAPADTGVKGHDSSKLGTQSTLGQYLK